MEAEELDFQLDELEIRLERLRALYEQYFLGLEKIEPTVPRKDVDRRIYVLRREKIRNTAKRFKLQTIIQRYNTFQQYWQRICREIENGTYKRHVLKAERTVGGQELLTIAARKRLGKAAFRGEPAAAEPVQSASPPAAPASAPPPAAPASAPPPAAPASAPPPAAAAAPAPKRAPVPARARPAQHFESLDLDMDFLGDWDPSKVKPPPKPRPSVPPARQSVVPPPPRPAAPPPPEPPKAAPLPEPPKAAPLPAPPRAPGPPPPPVRVPAPTARVPLAAARPKPEPPAPAPAPKPAAASLSEDRIKELHSRLNDMKRQNHEAGQVSFDGLAKSLRATEEKLRAQHQGRRVDFDVVVKDGKAVIKPILR